MGASLLAPGTNRLLAPAFLGALGDGKNDPEPDYGSLCSRSSCRAMRGQCSSVCFQQLHGLPCIFLVASEAVVTIHQAVRTDIIAIHRRIPC